MPNIINCLDRIPTIPANDVRKCIFRRKMLLANDSIRRYNCAMAVWYEATS